MHKKKNSIQSLALNFVEKKDNKSFSALIDRLKPGLYAFTRRYLDDPDLCDEVISQTFVSVWEKLEQYNPKYNFSTWVYAIAKNESLGLLRFKKRNLSYEKLRNSKLLKIYSPKISTDMEVVGPSGDNLTKFLYDRTVEEIHKLNEPYKSVMVHRELYNMQLQDIADKLEWNLSTVKTRIRKARKDIASTLQRVHPELIEAYYEESNE